MVLVVIVVTTNYDSNDNDKGGSCNARYGVDGSNRDSSNGSSDNGNKCYYQILEMFF